MLLSGKRNSNSPTARIHQIDPLRHHQQPPLKMGNIAEETNSSGANSAPISSRSEMQKTSETSRMLRKWPEENSQLQQQSSTRHQHLSPNLPPKRRSVSEINSCMMRIEKSEKRTGNTTPIFLQSTFRRVLQMNDLHGDALVDVIDVLSKTPVHDIAYNPVLENTLVRPHNPVQLPIGPLADFQDYAVLEQLDEIQWSILHPPGKTQNHRPTDNSIKEIVKLALVSSTYTAYSSLTQRYQQVDHAAKAWTDLRQDLESLIMNSTRGTSRAPEYLVMRPRIFTDFTRDHRSDNSRNDHHRRDDSRAPLEQRSVRSEPPQPSGYLSYDATINKQTRHEIRAASYISSDAPLKTPLCPNCDSATHRGAQCDSLTCHICQSTFPSAQLPLHRSP